MQPHTVAALLALNRRFYDRFASDFARTRQTWPLSFDRILPHLKDASNVLDLGCGNGRLLAFLAAHDWQGRYRGLDSSEALLAEAKAGSYPGSALAASFARADLFGDEWPEAVQQGGAPDAIVSLAVVHHIPGEENRRRFLAHCAGLLSGRTPLIISTWQFITSERLRRRTVQWETVGIHEADVEPGDYLVGWGQGAAGVRYCAAIDEAHLRDLAGRAGLECTQTFFSDGHEGNLNLYGVFTAR